MCECCICCSPVVDWFDRIFEFRKKRPWSTIFDGVGKFGQLVASLWMVMDIYLDANQSKTYYEYAFAENNTFLEQFPDETISKGYFYTAIAAWIAPPALVTLAVLPHYVFPYFK